MIFKSLFLWKAALSITITELAGSLGIKSCSTEQLKTAPLILQSKIDTVSKALSINAPITFVLLVGCQSCIP
jgi:hypothetical protein